MTEKPIMLPIKRIVTDSPRVKSFFFDYTFAAKPGQFVMVWIPGVGERPIAIFDRGKTFSISVAAAGTATSALHNFKVGQRVGFRGPYGTFFTIPEKKSNLVLIGGGYGMGPLAFLALVAKREKQKITVLNGARTKEELLFGDFFKKQKIKVLVSTDDGSLGRKGFIHELFLDYLKKNGKAKTVYVCGPERMEVEIARICWQKKIPFQVSLERYMKCGIGVCGCCSVDPTGWRMCVEGPILKGERLKKVKEFGKYHRSASGAIIEY